MTFIQSTRSDFQNGDTLLIGYDKVQFHLAFLSEDGEISSCERRLLNRLREKLGISERRAQELEDSLNSSQLTSDEQEYLEEYRACLEEGEISSKERRLLDRLRDKLGIHPSRAKELENLK